MRQAHIRCVRVTNKIQFDHCLSIRDKVFIQEQSVPVDREIDEHDTLEDPSTKHYLLIADGHPIGAARTLAKETGSIKVQRFAILGTERGKGYGKIFLEAIEKDTDYSVRTFILDAQEHAIPFYERSGYTVCSESFMDAGIVHKTMIKHKKSD